MKFYVDKENHADWHKYVEMVVFIYNTSQNATTGHSPFYLLHGFNPTQGIDLALLPKLPDHDVLEAITKLHDLRQKIPQIISSAQEKQKKQYDENRRDFEFEEGDLVLLEKIFVPGKGARKLAPLYEGPFRISRKISALNYEVELGPGRRSPSKVVHINRLKRYHANGGSDKDTT